MDLLFKKLETISTLSPPLKSYLISHIESFPYNINTYTSLQSFKSSILFFVSSGYLGGVRQNDTEETPLVFFSPGDFIIPYLTKPNKEFVNTLSFYTPTVLLAISLEDAKFALEVFPEALELFIRIIEEQIKNGNRRELLLRMPAQDRYTNLIATKPKLLLYCNSQQLANYLNISKRHFMRFKNSK